MRFLSKGSRVAVVGRLELDQWKDEHEMPRQRSYVVATQVNFLDPAPASAEREEEAEAEAEPVPAGARA